MSQRKTIHSIIKDKYLNNCPSNMFLLGMTQRMHVCNGDTYDTVSVFHCLPFINFTLGSLNPLMSSLHYIVK